MDITFLGTDSYFWNTAFLDDNFTLESIDVISISSTEIVLINQATGAITTLTGSGFSVSNDGEPLAGTVTSITFEQGGNTEATVTGVNWGLVDLISALEASEVDDLSELANLFNQSNTITVDASDAQAGFDWEDIFQDFTELVTAPIDFTGSDYEDHFQGGLGDDTVALGDSEPGEGNTIDATPGDDVIDFGGVSEDVWSWIGYDDFSLDLTFDINGETDTGSVTAASFTDTWLNVAEAMEADALSYSGGTGDDVFNITTTDDQWTGAYGLEGDDTFNLIIGDVIRLSYSWGRDSDPFTGLVVDLNTGVVSNDGLGGTDQINILGGDGELEIRATDNHDSITGSDRDERFILEQGNDTVDGGDGWDLVRYNRSGVDAIVVDLSTNTVTGTWDGNAFTDTLFNIEEIRGSREGDDQMTGSDQNEEFVGRGGNDTLDGGAGDDTLYGNEGDDSLLGGAGDDRLRGEEGNDILIGGDGRDDIRGGDGNDLIDSSTGSAESQGWGDYIRAGLGEDTIIGHQGLWETGEGTDISYADLSLGVTITSGADGTGTVTSDGEEVNDTFTYIHFFEGSQGDDYITGASDTFWEGFAGLGGNDTIDGGTGGGNNYVGYDYEHEYFDGAGSGIVADMATGLVTDTQGGTDTLLNINDVRGSVFDDLMSAEGLTTDMRFDGREGDDTLQGGTGNDVFEGGEGTDTLRMNVASSSVTLSEDDGWVVLTSAEGVDYIDGIEMFEFTDGTLTLDELIASGGFDGEDVVGSTDSDTLEGTLGDDTLTGRGGSDEIDAGIGDDSVAGGIGWDTVEGGSGNDTVKGNDGYDNLSGGAGDDSMTGNNGFDTIEGGEGADTIEGGLGLDSLSGDEGEDLLSGAEGADTLNGGSGEDTLNGNAGADTVEGGDDNDVLNGGINYDYLVGGSGDDTLNGNNGGDTLMGGEGDDRLEGNAGSDSLNGESGNDVLRGGIGVDTFVFEAGSGDDRIADFQNNIDTIEIDANLLSELSPTTDDLRNYASFDGDGNLVFTFDTGDSLTFTGVTNTSAVLDEIFFI